MADTRAQEVDKSFNRVLSGLGVMKAYRELPTHLRNVFRAWHFPKLTIQLEGGLTEQVVLAVKAELEEKLGALRFPGAPLGKLCFLHDYFATAIALAFSLRSLQTYPPSLAPQITHLAKALSPVLSRDVIIAALQSLFWELDNVLVKHNRLDRQILWVSLDTQNLPDGRPERHLVLHRQAPKTVSVRRDGYPREAFRCGQCFGNDGVVWVTWGQDDLGVHFPKQKFPVYVQKHVLDQLEARVDCFDNAAGHIHDFLWQSLLKPKFAKLDRPEQPFLVEYRFLGHKLGYLPVRIIDGKAVVLTFLFLTMDGTPESRLLQEHLKVRRNQRERLELDRLSTFLLTDVQDDPVVRNALEKCGCGHLFHVVKEDAAIRHFPGYAERVRNHLGVARLG